MVVNVLASDGRGLLLNHLLSSLHSLVAELRSLLLETGTDGRIITVVDLTSLGGSDAVAMLLGENLTVFDGLDGCVVVVLVDLLVDGSLSLLDAGLLHRLLHDSGSDLLMDGRILVAGIVPRKEKCVSSSEAR